MQAGERGFIHPYDRKRNTQKNVTISQQCKSSNARGEGSKVSNPTHLAVSSRLKRYGLPTTLALEKGSMRWLLLMLRPVYRLRTRLLLVAGEPARRCRRISGVSPDPGLISTSQIRTQIWSSVCRMIRLNP